MDSEQRKQDAEVGRAMRLLATSTFTVIVQPQRVIIYAYDDDGWMQLAVEPDFYSAALAAAGLVEEEGK